MPESGDMNHITPSENQKPPAEESPENLSQSQLIWRDFKRHKLAITGLIILFR